MANGSEKRLPGNYVVRMRAACSSRWWGSLLVVPLLLAGCSVFGTMSTSPAVLTNATPAPTPTATPVVVLVIQPPKSSLDTELQVLAHPLLLLLLGGAITGLAIPLFLRRWQDSQKDLEVKTGLVKQIAEVLQSVFADVESFDLGARNFDAERFNKLRSDWSTRSSVIEAQLLAYYKDGTILGEWARIAECVTIVVNLCFEDRPVFRSAEVRKLQDKLPLVLENCKLLERGKDAYEEGPLQYRAEWEDLKKELLNIARRLMAEILNARTALSDPALARKRAPPVITRHGA